MSCKSDVLQYDSVCGAGSQLVRRTLPQIDQHFIPFVKPCVVKLHEQVVCTDYKKPFAKLEKEMQAGSLM